MNNILNRALQRIIQGCGTTEDIELITKSLNDYFELCSQLATFRMILVSNEDYQKLTGKKIPTITIIGDRNA